jgi:hypothetical protein
MVFSKRVPFGFSALGIGYRGDEWDQWDVVPFGFSALGVGYPTPHFLLFTLRRTESDKKIIAH